MLQSQVNSSAEEGRPEDDGDDLKGEPRPPRIRVYQNPPSIPYRVNVVLEWVFLE